MRNTVVTLLVVRYLVSPLEAFVPRLAPASGDRLRASDGVEAQEQLLKVSVEHAVPPLSREAVPPRREHARTPFFPAETIRGIAATSSARTAISNSDPVITRNENERERRQQSTKTDNP